MERALPRRGQKCYTEPKPSRRQRAPGDQEELMLTFNHFNFNVADLDKSLAFYKEALGLEPVGENQLPGTYPMAVDEERSGELVYEVPSGFTDFSIAYLEQFVDDSGEESTGETFFVYFTAEDQTGASA